MIDAHDAGADLARRVPQQIGRAADRAARRRASTPSRRGAASGPAPRARATSMSPREMSISSASTSVTEACSPARASEPSNVRISRTVVVEPEGSAMTRSPDGDRARFDAPHVAARQRRRRAADVLNRKAQRRAGERRRALRRFRGSAAASGRRTTAGARPGRRPCRPRAPTSARSARRAMPVRWANASKSATMAANASWRQSARSILFTATTRCGMPSRCAIVACRRVCMTTPCRASTSRIASCAVDAAVTMLRVYWSWPGASAMMNLRKCRREVPVRDVDGDSLLALRDEPVGEEREVEHRGRAAATCARWRRAGRRESPWCRRAAGRSACSCRRRRCPR